MDEEVEITYRPMRHDRWSILIPALNFTYNVLEAASTAALQYGIMAAQHSAQREYDRKFQEIMK